MLSLLSYDFMQRAFLAVIAMSLFSPVLGTFPVSYTHLFFDFAGYSMFALAISNLMGIHSPINFNKPFLSRDLKEFWNRWHMSLSFWFRDFVFMRMVMVLTRKKVFKNRNVTSSVAYILNMLIMGFWHGVTSVSYTHLKFPPSLFIIIFYEWLSFLELHKSDAKNRTLI